MPWIVLALVVGGGFAWALCRIAAEADSHFGGPRGNRGNHGNG